MQHVNYLGNHRVAEGDASAANDKVSRGFWWVH